MNSTRAFNSAAADNETFYQEHLDRVSRSFAFCIARLESPLRERVGLGYLVCRLVDTIEDVAWPSFDDQEIAFRKFDSFIERPARHQEIAEWVRSFPPDGVSEGERELLGGCERLFRDYHSWDPQAQEALRRPVLSMSAGMREFMRKKSANGGELRLKSLNDVNRYCFFVAGVVGEMLSRFLGLQAKAAGASLKDAFRFGLFLQKINILKDQSTDERAGRFLVPVREEVRASMLDDSRVALQYLLSLPAQETGFRLFCAWSLFLGLASVPWMDRSFNEHARFRIPRDRTFEVLGEVESRIDDGEALTALFRELREPLVTETPLVRETEAPATTEELCFVGLYEGSLAKKDIIAVFRGT